MNGLFSQMTLRTSDDFENGTAHANVSMASYEEVCRSCGKVWHSAGRMVPTRTMQNGADYNDFPTDSLLYNLTGDTEYLDRAVTSLRWYAQAELNGTLADCSNHCFEPLNSYQILVEMGHDPFAGLPHLLNGFRQAMVKNCADLKPDHRGTEAVHNHGIDYALDLTYLLRVFPDIVDVETAGGWRAAANQTWQDWLHGHALMVRSNYCENLCLLYNTVLRFD